jgi:CDP-glucose 4,6-dehydratase
MRLFGDVFRGKKVLLTGHTGFKGSWLSLWLAELGAEVYGYALKPPTTPSMFEDANIASVMAGDIIGDVRDFSHLESQFSQIKPEFVFHLAAQPLVRASYDEPRETYETNVMGTVNILEAIRRCGSVRVCHVVSTDKCYENKGWVYAYRENDRLGGHDPYSNSKGCAEMVVSAYGKSFFPSDDIDTHGVSLSSGRAGNVIGGGDWATDRLIPDCMRSLLKDEKIQIRYPQAIRPWQHVLEPLSGYLWLAAMQWKSPGVHEGGWNFGPGGKGNISVSELVEIAVAHWNRGEWERDTPAGGHPHEAAFLKLDITKAGDCLNWEPCFSVHEAIQHTMDWYSSHKNNTTDMKQYTVDQIAYYANKAAEQKISWAES